MRSHRSWLLLALVIFTACKSELPPTTAPASSSIDLIRQSIQHGDLTRAESLVVSALVETPEDRELLTIAGDLAFGRGNHAVAILRYQSIPTKPDAISYHANYQLARAFVETGRAYDAVEILERTCIAIPNETKLKVEVGGLLFSIGDNWRAKKHLEGALLGGSRDLPILTMLLDPTRPQNDTKSIEGFLKAQPKDLRPLLGLAREHLHRGDLSAATDELTRILTNHPGFAPAYVLQGRCLLEQQPDQLEVWYREHPKAAEEDPDYWTVLGRWLASHEQYHEAARCLLESIARDANHRDALVHLSMVLLQLGETQESALAQQRATDLALLADISSRYVDWKKQSQREASRVAAQLLRLGRVPEAHAWCSLAAHLREDLDPGLKRLTTTIFERLKSDAPIVSPEHQLTAKIDRTKYPLPSERLSIEASESEPDVHMVASEIRLIDESTSRGMVFKYENGDDPDEPGLWIHQSNGGGVAVIDFDLNGWPDVYFTQAGGAPMDDSAETPNQLFRNVDGMFTNVTAASTAGAHGYGQGVTVGDYDSDGFPDLFCASIGMNRVYRNNGDGTFSERTFESKIGTQKGWSTSLALADFNLDGIGDLYVVNYLAGDEPYRVRCKSVCVPTAFAPAADQLFMGRDDGVFENRTEACLRDENPGRGLGVLVADFDRRPGLEIFVANDMSANHFWVPTLEDPMHFVESAVSHGVAFDLQGRAQACMGIAAADVDRDQDLDLLVTNFSGESNALYMQTSRGQFQDQSRVKGISEPSFPMLGFGTQFVDLNLDGVYELAVVNGHVSDHEKATYGYEMRAQVFGLENHQWRELPSHSLGPFFEQKHLGRALSLIDANRDRLPDLLISQLVEPSVLLINHSKPVGTSMGLRLVGTRSHRDAVGTHVFVKSSTGQRYYQRVTGDGFQGKNQDEIWVTLEPQETIDQVKVAWPSGLEQTFSGLHANQDYLIVEGDDRPYAL